MGLLKKCIAVIEDEQSDSVLYKADVPLSRQMARHPEVARQPAERPSAPPPAARTAVPVKQPPPAPPPPLTAEEEAEFEKLRAKKKTGKGMLRIIPTGEKPSEVQTDAAQNEIPKDSTPSLSLICVKISLQKKSSGASVFR
jgi:hypothetical protein